MFCRHDRIWLSAAGWERAAAGVPRQHAAELVRWGGNGWPAVIRRAGPEAAPDTACLGVALPPDEHEGRKIRIPFSARIDDIRRHEQPLGIAGIEPALPAAWRGAFMRLSQAAAAGQLLFRAFGSVALQAATGQRYVTAASDIDLLFYPRTGVQLRDGLALLSDYADLLPLDGEIVFPSARAVSWKEWAQALESPAGPRVLTKGVRSVSLVDCADLRAELE